MMHVSMQVCIVLNQYFVGEINFCQAVHVLLFSFSVSYVLIPRVCLINVGLYLIYGHLWNSPFF